MKNLLKIALLAVVAIVAGACDKEEEKTIEIIEHVYSEEMIQLSLELEQGEETYISYLERLYESGWEWYEDVWFHSASGYSDTENLGSPIYSLHGYPVVEIPQGIERNGFQFFREGKLTVWNLDKENKKGEPMSGEWHCDTANGTLSMSYTDLNGELHTMSGFLEALWWKRDMVVTILNSDSSVNYYVWRAEWHS